MITVNGTELKPWAKMQCLNCGSDASLTLCYSCWYPSRGCCDLAVVMTMICPKCGATKISQDGKDIWNEGKLVVSRDT